VAGGGDGRARDASIGLAEAPDFIEYDPPRPRPPPEPPPQSADLMFTAVATPTIIPASEPLPQRPFRVRSSEPAAFPVGDTLPSRSTPGAPSSQPSPWPLADGMLACPHSRLSRLDFITAGPICTRLVEARLNALQVETQRFIASLQSPLPPPLAVNSHPPDVGLTPPTPDAHPRHWPSTPALATIVATSRDTLPFPSPLPPPLPARPLEVLPSASPSAGCGLSPPLTPMQATRSGSRLGCVDSSPPTCHLDFEEPTPPPLPPPPLICLPASLTDIVFDAASAKYYAAAQGAIQEKAAEAKVRAAAAKEERSRYRARTAEMAALSRRAAASRPHRRRRGARRGRTQGGATARPTAPMGEG
jgi:hypothetical protein